eukprot:692743-Pelagomonas_calceolata.AAC.2
MEDPSADFHLFMKYPTWFPLSESTTRGDQLMWIRQPVGHPSGLAIVSRPPVSSPSRSLSPSPTAWIAKLDGMVAVRSLFKSPQHESGGCKSKGLLFG